MLDLPAIEGATAAARRAAAPGASHRVARLPGGILLLEADCAAPALPGIAELEVGGETLPPPSAAMLLGDPAAPRLLFATRDEAGRLVPGAACRLSRGGQLLASFALDRPADPTALLIGREEPERLALLRFLLLTAGPTLGAGAGLAASCHALARAVAAGAAAQPLCRPGATLSLWSVPRAAPGAWQVIEHGRLRRAECRAGVLVIAGPAPAADTLLLPPGAAARPLPLAPLPAALPALRDFLARGFRGDARAGQALAALSAGAERGRWTGLLREVQLLVPARPHREVDPVSPVGGALELALSDEGGGLFLRGWLRDPLGLVAGMELRSVLGRAAIPPGALHRVARPELKDEFTRAAFAADDPLPGFVAHLPDADDPAVAQWRLSLRLGSGEAIELVAPPARFAPAAARDLVLRAALPATLPPGLLEKAIAPAAWRLHQAAMRPGGTPDRTAFGAAPRRPRIALVVPLYRNLRFLRFQLASFARDAALREAEIVYVLDSPEQRGQVEHLLRGMAALTGVAAVLVTMPQNRGYASACNAGAAASRAPVIGFLNSDVLPAAPGWSDALLARLSRERRLAAVGPKLLFGDGAIQHAGLLFRRGLDGEWLNDHYFKGFPRTTAAANVARRVPAVTGAALFVRRKAFDTAGGFCTDYVIGDFEDSDLCLSLRAAGHEIGYEPAAELYHFERQSIAGHDGHAQTLAGAYNRLLHHRRWDAAIAAVMARFGAEG
ncbi:glycosyltransferase family 2 protein [Falsiroseomonas sp. HW251]|uniref:glycosyltransferase family 2 protein n=1 Tax=Falsiroseomonas sp. HW251 TaxID=3390998 RepID=UPI003D3198A0